MTTTTTDPDPPQCPACSSVAIVLAYRAPVYVLVKSGHAARVVVADEEVVFDDQAWCRRCGERWRVDGEPELGTWPAWEVGW